MDDAEKLRDQPANWRQLAAQTKGTLAAFAVLAQRRARAVDFVHIHDGKRSGLITLNSDDLVSYDIKPGKDGRVSAVNLEVG